MRYKKILLLMMLSGLFLNMFAGEYNSVLKPGIIKGFVIDSQSNQPMEFTTIALKQISDSTIVSGAITDVTGLFRIKDVQFGNYYLEISFMGYKDLTTNLIELNNQQSSYDAGRLLMSPTDATLSEVVVVADRPTMTYHIDKKVINVSQLHTSASGSAVEVLENIPSVTVSIEGDVSLRGSGSFTVLIDGKPSILAANDILNQIPASQIESIEIITNPSARFEPDGVAGIINIVMKKNLQQGMNGVLNLNAGTPGRYGGDLLLNYRKERFNFFFGTDYNKRNYLGQSIRINETYEENLTSFLNSDGDFTNNRTSLGMRVGVDITINPSSSFNVGYRLGDRKHGSGSDRFYEEWNSANLNRLIYSSLEDNVRGGFSNSLIFDYKLDFNQEGHGISTHLVLESSNSKDNSINLLLKNQLDTISGQRSLEAGPSQEYTIRFDYSLPINENQKIEAGYQTSIDISDESNVLRQFNPLTSNFELDNLFSKEVRYYLAIHSLYSTFSGMMGDLGYQFGVRTEYTDRLVDLLGETDEFTLNQWDYYPTVHFSYELSENQQTMASYTRRLQRLRGWYLEPFYTWDDAYNVRIGNPNLKPEYIDSYEASYQYRFENGNMLSTDVYYRITHNKIERVRRIYEDQPNVLLSSMFNLGKDYSLGTEIMFGWDIVPWWHLDLMTNIYDYRQEGKLNGRDYSAASFNWNARLNNDFKITPSTRVQFRGMYNSPTASAQGERAGYFVTHFAMKQDFMNRNLSLTFQISDIFGTSSRETIYRDLEFYNFSSWDPNTPFFSISLMYKINNYTAERRGPEQGRDDMNGGEEF